MSTDTLIPVTRPWTNELISDGTTLHDVMYDMAENFTSASRHTFLQTFNIAFQIFLFIGTMIGNLILLVAVWKSKTGKRSRTSFFVTHLAIADLLVAVFSSLIDIIWKLTGQWYAGPAMCLIVRYIQAVVTYAATYVLVSLSIDRWDAIARPMKFSGGGYRAKILVSLAWFSALAFSIPMLFINKYFLDPTDGKLHCRIKLGSRRNWQIYLSLISAAVFIIPAIMILICYIIIIYVIWTKSKSGLTLPDPKKSSFARRIFGSTSSKGSADELSLREGQIQCRMNSRGVIPQAKIRTVKMTFVIVIVFILCWCPYFVYDLLQVFVLLPTTAHKSLSVFVQSLTTLNSFMNPLIYGIFTSNVCRSLRQDKNHQNVRKSCTEHNNCNL